MAAAKKSRKAAKKVTKKTSGKKKVSKASKKKVAKKAKSTKKVAKKTISKKAVKKSTKKVVKKTATKPVKKAAKKISKKVTKKVVKKSEKAVPQKAVGPLVDLKKAKKANDLAAKAMSSAKKTKKDDFDVSILATKEGRKWKKLYDSSKNIKARMYKMSEVFEEKSPIEHKVLGWGYVLSSQNDRLEVLFKDGVRTLISNFKR